MGGTSAHQLPEINRFLVVNIVRVNTGSENFSWVNCNANFACAMGDKTGNVLKSKCCGGDK